MKKIVAIIKPFKFEEVSEALRKLGVGGITITEVQGAGRQMGHNEIYSGAPYATSLLPKLMLECVLPSDQVNDAMQVIQKSAQTGHIGDGKIFVTPVEMVVRIRTGETGADAV